MCLCMHLSMYMCKCVCVCVSVRRRGYVGLHMPVCAVDCNLVFLLTLHLDSLANDCSSESNRNSFLKMD